jgi:hypothetical protein
MDESVKSQIKSQYPNQKIFPITSPSDGIEILVIGAPEAIWVKYQAMARDFTDSAKRTAAEEMLVRGSMVWPNHEEFHKGLQERHLMGFYQKAAALVVEISGARDDVKLGEAL